MSITGLVNTLDFGSVQSVYKRDVKCAMELALVNREQETYYKPCQRTAVVVATCTVTGKQDC